MKMMHKKKALTLVELMVAMAIAAILILTVVTVLLMAYRAWNTNNAYVSLRRDAAFAMEIMARDIRESTLNDIDDSTGLSIEDEKNIKGYSVDYTLSGTTLDCARRDGASDSFSLASDTTSFDPNKTSDGVIIELVMEDTEFDIVITNETFIRIRN